MNILLTSVGRRAYMVKYFKKVLGKEGQVHVGNSDALTVAFSCADKSVVTPLIYEEEYIPFLLNYCKQNRIDLLLSLFDIDLPVLSRSEDAFAAIGTQIVVSNPAFVEMCNDKWKTYLFLRENAFHAPKTFLFLDDAISALEKGEISYPVIVKPRFGCGSIEIGVAENREELEFFYRKKMKAVEETYLKYESAAVAEKLIIQECLKGQEYGADIINDLRGRHQTAIVKKKIAMRAGETDIAEVVDEPAILAEVTRLGQLSGHVANLDCDIFMVDGIPYILELNARFGGGYPFSHLAGCNLPKAIILWAKGEEVDKKMLQAQPGVRGYKELVLTMATED